ncbi:MAG: hypothetical protein KDD64_17430, partial [Bdellovibrionales bacterium]|nr:hypothetical protein [Bdellovibrionales bacterium]
MNRITRLIVICHISVLFLPIALFGQTSKVVSVSTNGQSGDGPSFLPHLSRNGRYVVFRSLATNFTSKDTGGVAQIYLHDRKLGTTFLISQNAEGEVANAGNSPPFISATGRYVAWGTTASNLVPGDTNELSDCFIYDRVLNTLERRVVQRNGEDIAACFDILETRPVISLSKDGRYAAIQASGGVWVLDRKTTSLTLLSDVDGNGVGGRPVISADGSTVVFNSPNANIGSTGASKGTSNIWTYDIANGTYELISKGFNGDGADKSCERASISDDGRRVLYDSSAQNLVDDGSTNEGVFLYDRDTGITIRVSKDLDGNPVDSTTEFSYISGNGLFAAFSTRGVLSSELNTDDFKIGIYDIEAETTLPIGTAAGETSADRTSLYPVMDGVGYRTVFFSQATNISEDDTHGVGQVFLDTVVHCENSS